MAKDKKNNKKQMKILKKEQREDVLKVVEKWQQKKFHYSDKARSSIGSHAMNGLMGGSVLPHLFLADAFVTGGLATGLCLGFGTLMGGYLAKASCNEERARYGDWINKAGQSISSDPLVRLALEGMQIKLSDKFNTSSAAKGAEKAELDFEFNQMAQDVRQDLGVLKSSYIVTEGGAKGYGTDQFEFELSAIETKEVVTKKAVSLGSIVNDNDQQKKTTRHNRPFDL